MLYRLADLAPDDPLLGGKGQGLRRLLSAGLAVPETWILGPGTPASEAASALALGPPIIARSSAADEDGALAAAPGIFVSRGGAGDAGAIIAAAQAVRDSLASPVARAYRQRLALPEGQMSVLLQHELPGRRATVYSRAPGRPDELLVELGDVPTPLARDGRWLGEDPGVDGAEIARLALAAEAALGAPHGADVELVIGERITVVQARPIRAAAPAGRLHAFSAAEPGVRWRWDASHNPAPLSPAQAGLVALVDGIGLRQRVVDGYLYYSRDGAPPIASRWPAAELVARWATEIQPAFEDALAPLERAPALPAALAGYVGFYRVYAELAAPLGEARRLDPVHRQAGMPSIGVRAWDVAAAPLGEPARAPAVTSLAGLAEADDVYFARAQLAVRRALLDSPAGRMLGDDVFWLPLAEVVAGVPPDGAARAAAARATTYPAPAPWIVAGRGVVLPPAASAVLRGAGAGVAVEGLVARLDPGHAAPPGRVVVAETILPGMALFLNGALALVTEHGGPLGHGAALARELGLPHVVGARGAWALLEDGQRVLVDGDAGLVLRLES